MSNNDYWNAFKSYQPGGSQPNYQDLMKTHGHYTAEQIQRGWQAAHNSHSRSNTGNSSSGK